MYADLVKCTNCSTEDMKIPVGNEICPICGALGTLMFMDDENPEIECSEEELLYIHSHDYKPTDTEGHSYECQECGHYNSSWYGMESNGKLLNPKELLDYSVNSTAKKDTINEVVIGRENFDLDFYKAHNDKTGPIYAEICSKYIIENLKKLYGENAITSYETIKLNNDLLAIKAIVPSHPAGFVMVYEDDCSQEMIDSIKKVLMKMTFLTV